MEDARVNWVDYGKGICIMLVVMMHSTLGYGEMVHQTGWMHDVVVWAKPFRMPDFFMIAGLFLSLSIHGPLLRFIDRKVVHFAYFYLLWLAIQTLAFEADVLLHDPVAFAVIFAKQLIFPASSLWFIHMLLVFYVVTRLLRQVPVLVVFAGAVVLHSAFYAGWLDTGWSVTERFANWYVFFFAGYAFAPAIFRFAEHVRGEPVFAMMALVAWGIWNGVFVHHGSGDVPGISLAMGFAGALAIVAVASLLSRFEIGSFVRYAGKNSIVIYLTFFIPMKLAQKGLAMTGLVSDAGTACLIVVSVGVLVPLAIHWMVRGTTLRYLYVRPDFLKFERRVGQHIRYPAPIS